MLFNRRLATITEETNAVYQTARSSKDPTNFAAVHSEGSPTMVSIGTEDPTMIGEECYLVQ